MTQLITKTISATVLATFLTACGGGSETSTIIDNNPSADIDNNPIFTKDPVVNTDPTIVNPTIVKEVFDINDNVGFSIMLKSLVESLKTLNSFCSTEEIVDLGVYDYVKHADYTETPDTINMFDSYNKTGGPYYEANYEKINHTSINGREETLLQNGFATVTGSLTDFNLLLTSDYSIGIINSRFYDYSFVFNNNTSIDYKQAPVTYSIDKDQTNYNWSRGNLEYHSFHAYSNVAIKSDKTVYTSDSLNFELKDYEFTKIGASKGLIDIYNNKNCKEPFWTEGRVSDYTFKGQFKIASLDMDFITVETSFSTADFDSNIFSKNKVFLKGEYNGDFFIVKWLDKEDRALRKSGAISEYAMYKIVINNTNTIYLKEGFSYIK